MRPATLEVAVRPDLPAAAGTDLATKALVDKTLPVLRPAVSGHAPDPAMFTQRYAHYADQYSWLGEP